MSPPAKPDAEPALGRGPLSHKGDSDAGVLMLHGFTGTPGNLFPLMHRFIGMGLHVEAPLLSGHGTRWPEMNRCSWRDWVEDAERGLEVLRRRAGVVFAAGLSMGGLLALHLAETEPDLTGLIPVNPAVFLSRSPFLPWIPWLKKVLKAWPSSGSDIKDSSVKPETYGLTPLPALHELLKLQDRVRGDLGRVKQPTLIMQSRQDHVVDPEGARMVFQTIASEDKELVWLDNSYHVATLDFDAGRICDLAARFISRLTGVTSGVPTSLAN